MSALPEPIDCHFCVEKPDLRKIAVVYETARKTGPHEMYRMECRCGTIGKCRPDPESAIETWNEPWQARVGKHFLTLDPDA